MIELDGNVHGDASQAEDDSVRQKEIEARGLIVLRFKNEEVIDNLSVTLEKIVAALESRHP